jgi:hypothetical protein
MAANQKGWNVQRYQGDNWVNIVAPSVIRGDVNDNGQVDINDVTVLINFVLSGDSTGVNLEAANTDQQGGVDINDVTALIARVLTGSW